MCVAARGAFTGTESMNRELNTVVRTVPYRLSCSVVSHRSAVVNELPISTDRRSHGRILLVACETVNKCNQQNNETHVCS